MDMLGVNKTYIIGLLEDSAGKMISQGVLMGEDLSGCFSVYHRGY